MDRKLLTVLGVSLVFALVVSSIFYQLSSRGSGPKKTENDDLRDVVVATKPLDIGSTVKAEDLKLVKLPASAFPKGAFSKVEDVVDRPVMSSILVEEPVVDGRLAQRGSGAGLAPVIPVGMRAVTVRVNDVVGVAGFVLPGMRVDVLITGDPPGTTQRITRTVLQNILVLSAGKTIQTDSTGKPVDAPSVTVLVSPTQAEILTLAGNTGRIQLVLRNGGDQNIEKTAGTNLTFLYGGKFKADGVTIDNSSNSDLPGENPKPRPRPRPVVAMAPPPPAPPPAPVVDQIVTIRGTDRKVETVSIRNNN
jgi:pilus assembly protein CpaB